MSLDATVRGQVQTLHTVVEGTTARTDVVTDGRPTQKSDTIDRAAVLILSTPFFAPYEAIAAQFVKANFNLKEAFKQWAVSPFYRADGVTTGTDNPQRQAELADIGPSWATTICPAHLDDADLPSAPEIRQA